MYGSGCSPNTGRQSRQTLLSFNIFMPLLESGASPSGTCLLNVVFCTQRPAEKEYLETFACSSRSSKKLSINFGSFPRTLDVVTTRTVSLQCPDARELRYKSASRWVSSSDFFPEVIQEIAVSLLSHTQH